LYPPHLDQDGLKASLQEYVEGFSARAGIRSKISIAVDVDALSIDLQRSILRIVQEALTNVHHHAAASHVSVRIAMNDEDGLVISVEDDGKGIVRSRPGRRPGRWHLGVGVPGMRARLWQFGGTLEIGSTKRGTSVVATIPRAVAYARRPYKRGAEPVLHLVGKHARHAPRP
jgi:signal transduction histidine kinase